MLKVFFRGSLTVYFVGEGGQDWIKYITTNAHNDGILHHYIVTIGDATNNEIKMYIDGIEQTQWDTHQVTGAISNFTYTESLKIGQRGDGIEYCDGTLKDVIIWNKPLTVLEAKALYDNGGNPMNVEVEPKPESTNLEASLQSYYTFDNNYNDNTSHNFNGSGNGISFTETSKLGTHSLSFDGQKGNYASFGNGDTILNSENPDEWSVSFWIYPKSWGGEIINFYDGSSDPIWGLRATLSSSGVGGYTRQDSSCQTGNCYVDMNTNSQAMSLNSWHHLSLTYSKLDGIAKTYLNGQLVDSDTMSADTDFFDGGRLLMGNIYYGGDYNYPLNANLDEVSIWNRAITQNEVAELYNDGNGCSFDGNSFICEKSPWLIQQPLAYYPLTENAEDKSGNENHGTPNGEVSFGENGGDFDGNGDYIVFPNTDFDVSTQNFTICSYADFDNLDNEDFINERISTSETKWDFNLAVRDGKIRFFISDGSNTALTYSNSNISTGTFYYICKVVTAGTDAKMYINGDYNTSMEISHIGNTSDGHGFNIGAYVGDSSHDHTGKVKNLTIFNTALTDLEVKALYDNNGSPMN